MIRAAQVINVTGNAQNLVKLAILQKQNKAQTKNFTVNARNVMIIMKLKITNVNVSINKQIVKFKMEFVMTH